MKTIGTIRKSIYAHSNGSVSVRSTHHLEGRTKDAKQKDASGPPLASSSYTRQPNRPKRTQKAHLPRQLRLSHSIDHHGRLVEHHLLAPRALLIVTEFGIVRLVRGCSGGLLVFWHLGGQAGTSREYGGESRAVGAFFSPDARPGREGLGLPQCGFFWETSKRRSPCGAEDGRSILASYQGWKVADDAGQEPGPPQGRASGVRSRSCLRRSLNTPHLRFFLLASRRKELPAKKRRQEQKLLQQVQGRNRIENASIVSHLLVAWWSPVGPNRKGLPRPREKAARCVGTPSTGGILRHILWGRSVDEPLLETPGSGRSDEVDPARSSAAGQCDES